MPIDRETWTRICQLFDDLIALAPDERRTAMAERCAGEDQIVRREIERMLAADEQNEAWVDRPLARVPEGDVHFAFWANGPAQGEQIGAFTLDRILGEGGMATVWLAHQADPPRPVALKLQRGGLRLSAQALARFRYETEVLAQLKHPAIARLFEAGTHWRKAGDDWFEVPYLAMEYVDGARDLVAYATEHELDTDARLSLFASVCSAVSHAHKNGILHRDLKRQNLLVDSDGNVKVIDFGIARPTSGREGAEQWTEDGQLVGTLTSMSPEQLRGGGDLLDVRSDVYALGCVLYELLEDRPPFYLDTGALAEAMLIVSEGRALPMRKVARELSWIVRRAMAPERERRYGTVDELEDDLRRLAANEPLRAGPQTRLYAARKFVRRHRALVWSGIAVVASLAVGLVRSEQARARAELSEASSARDARLAEEASEQSELARERAEISERKAVRDANRAHVASARMRALHDFFMDMVEGSGGPRTPVVTMLDRARQRLENEFHGDPMLRAGIQGTLAKSYEDLGMHDAARALLEPAFERVAEHGTPGDMTWFQVHLDWMQFLVLDRRFDEVLQICELLEPWARNEHGLLFDPQVHANLVARRAAVHYFLKHYEQAEAGFEESLALYEANAITGDAQYWVALGNLGTCRRALHDFEGAIECLDRRLAEPGLTDRARASALEELGKAHAELGEHEQAADLLSEALELYERTEGERAASRVAVLALLGEQFARLESFALAEGILLEVGQAAALVTQPPLVAHTARVAERSARCRLAWIAFEQGDAASATAAIDALLEHYDSGEIEREATWFEARLLQASLLEASGNSESSVRLLRDGIDWTQAALLTPLQRERLLDTWVRCALATGDLTRLADTLRDQIGRDDSARRRATWQAWLDEVEAMSKR